MSRREIRDYLIPIITFCIILIVSAAVISYGRGYRLDITRKSINPTGLLAATSDPTGAQILIDGKLTSATNTTVNLTPGWYSVTIAKEGFQPWEKRLRIATEVVTRADAFLFPGSPSLSTLTTSGIANPTLSPDGSKLAYVVPKQKDQEIARLNRAGVWILDLVNKPLGINRDARQIANSSFVDFSTATLSWSPDSKELLVALSGPRQTSYYLLSAERGNDSPRRLTEIVTTISQWDILAVTREKEKLSILNEKVLPVATSSMKILPFAPDESKFLYEATNDTVLPTIITPPLVGVNSTEETRAIKSGNLYVYDIKEDRNYLLGTKADFGFPTPTSTPKPAKKSAPQSPQLPQSPQSPLFWLPTSRHLILVSQDKIEAMDFDASNRRVIYAGPFRDRFVAPWFNASKLLILTTLNPSVSPLPNLYAINIR